MAVVLTVLGGCRAGYVARVGIQHLRYMHSARPIADVIDETADADERELLRLVLDAREYAKSMGLSVGGSYSRVARTEKLTTGFVVTAAYSDRLEPYAWRYPIVGRIPYRGYFSREPADRFAAKLEKQRLDTYVVRAAGYSTLGWFDDPLPSGALKLGKVGVADLVFHELTHQTLFVPNETAFNETLASVIGMRLASEFFGARQDAEAVAEAGANHERWLRQSDVCNELATELVDYYETAEQASRASSEIFEDRAAIYDRYRSRLIDVGLLDEGSEVVLNNASFLAVLRYRKKGRAVDDFVAGFDNPVDSLARIEEHVDGGEEPYRLIALESDVID